MFLGSYEGAFVNICHGVQQRIGKEYVIGITYGRKRLPISTLLVKTIISYEQNVTGRTNIIFSLYSTILHLYVFLYQRTHGSLSIDNRKFRNACNENTQTFYGLEFWETWRVKQCRDVLRTHTY